jgi:thiol:disulfide interchange protein DsbA
LGCSLAPTSTWPSARWRRRRGSPVEGRHYVRLSTPVSTSLPAAKKIEVFELFWYECPHCHDLEPAREQWVRQQP